MCKSISDLVGALWISPVQTGWDRCLSFPAEPYKRKQAFEIGIFYLITVISCSVLFPRAQEVIWWTVKQYFLRELKESQWDACREWRHNTQFKRGIKVCVWYDGWGGRQRIIRWRAISLLESGILERTVIFKRSQPLSQTLHLRSLLVWTFLLTLFECLCFWMVIFLSSWHTNKWSSSTKKRKMGSHNS